MAYPFVEITEERRLKLCLYGTVAGRLCLVPSLIFVFIGIYIIVDLASTSHLLEGYNHQSFPSFLIFLGCLNLIVYAFGSQVCSYTKSTKKRQKMAKLLFAYVIATSILSSCVFLAGIICFVQITNLEDALDRGLSDVMSQYKDDTEKKIEMDTLQIDFKCCGINRYTDWFKTVWIHRLYTFSATPDKPRDDVPFSCCDPDVFRPCIHYDVQTNKVHHRYDFSKQLTIYSKGCKTALMEEFGDNLLHGAAWTILGMSILQFGCLIIARFLQTSVYTAIECENIEADTYGFLIKWGEANAEKIKQIKEGIMSGKPESTKGDGVDGVDGEPKETDSLIPKQASIDDIFTDSTFDEPETLTKEQDNVEVRTENEMTQHQRMSFTDRPAPSLNHFVTTNSALVHASPPVDDRNARFRRIANLIGTKNRVISGFRRGLPTSLQETFTQPHGTSNHTFENVHLGSQIPTNNHIYENIHIGTQIPTNASAVGNQRNPNYASNNEIRRPPSHPSNHTYENIPTDASTLLPNSRNQPNSIGNISMMLHNNRGASNYEQGLATIQEIRSNHVYRQGSHITQDELNPTEMYTNCPPVDGVNCSSQVLNSGGSHINRVGSGTNPFTSKQRVQSNERFNSFLQHTAYVPAEAPGSMHESPSVKQSVCSPRSFHLGISSSSRQEMKDPDEFLRQPETSNAMIHREPTYE